MKKLKRKNPFTNCRNHAKIIAHKKTGSIADCPYKKNPYRSVWINTLQSIQQADWVGWG